MRGFDGTRILVVGDIMLDLYTRGTADRVSPEAPCVVLSHSEEFCRPGGAANVAAQLDALGASVCLCGLLGDDSYGSMLRHSLACYSVELLTVPASYTTTKHRFISGTHHQLLRIDKDLHANLSISCLNDIIRRISGREFHLVVLSDYDRGVLTPDACSSIINQCKRSRIPVIADIKGAPFTKYRGATMIKGNQTEITSLCRHLGLDSTSAAAEMLHTVAGAMDCRYAAMTAGADGITIASADNTVISCKAAPAQIYDVTGAGDVVLAYLALALADVCSLSEAAAMAMKAAAVKISRVGTGIVRMNEIDRSAKILDSALQLPASVRKGITVFTNGCFDILHPGHIDLLEQARAQGDVLIVGINTDESVRRLKGPSRPVNALAQRAGVLAALQCVDYIIPFADDTPLSLIGQISPDVLVKGGDYTPDTVVGADCVTARGGKVVIVPLLPGYSSTRIIQSCRL